MRPRRGLTSTPGLARSGRLSLPGRSRSEHREEAQCSGQHRQAKPTRPLPLPSTSPPEQADHTHERTGRAGWPAETAAPSSASAPALRAEGVHVLKREINAGESSEQFPVPTRMKYVCMHELQNSHFCESTYELNVPVFAFKLKTEVVQYKGKG